jgi:hypothetical protein
MSAGVGAARAIPRNSATARTCINASSAAPRAAGSTPAAPGSSARLSRRVTFTDPRAATAPIFLRNSASSAPKPSGRRSRMSSPRAFTPRTSHVQE